MPLLRHRRPDGKGYYRDERCELMHRRSALPDLLPIGQQPMVNEDGSVLGVFTGGIYNYPPLRSLLDAREHVIRSTSDTEALVHLERGAWREHGVPSPDSPGVRRGDQLHTGVFMALSLELWMQDYGLSW